MVKIKAAKESVEDILIQQLKPLGVRGVGIGKKEQSEKRDVINIYVEKLTAELMEKIPPKIAGYPVQVIESGKFYALSVLPALEATPKQVDRTVKWRPMPAGVSIGHHAISAGTAGWVINGLILSNNHVLANSSSVETVRAAVGDLILQPGPADFGVQPDDVIGELHSFVPLSETGVNYVDAAWCRPYNVEDVLEGEILKDDGSTVVVAEAAEPTVDMQIFKCGRTSGETSGLILDVSATVVVDYYDFEATFKEQIVAEKTLDPGDSGSLGVDVETMRAVGLGFAGSDSLSLFNRIEYVLADMPPAAVLPRAEQLNRGLLALGLTAAPLLLKTW